MAPALPLYPAPTLGPEDGGYASALELERSRDLNHDCRLCPLATRHSPKTVCIPPAGDPGGVLVVGEGPGRDEDHAGVPFVGVSGRYLAETIKQHYSGPVAVDNAVRCFPGKDTAVRAQDVDVCRGYLAKRLLDVRPKRIICVGATASYAVLGRRISPMSARKAYGWIASKDIPVFVVMHPAAALRNRRFLAPMFEADLAWALNATPPNPPPRSYTYRLVQTLDDALEAEHELRDGFAFDCETAGSAFDTDFLVFNVAACAYDATSAWVWDYKAVSDDKLFVPLKRILRSPSVPKTGHNLKYDMLAMRAGRGTVVRGAENDTLMDHRVLDPEADGDLGSMAELVGMGGHKIEAELAIHKHVRSIRSRRAAGGGLQGSLFEDLSWVPPEVEAEIRLGVDPDKYKYALADPDVMNRYNARDAVATALLRKHNRSHLARAPELHRVADEMVFPAVRAYEQIEAWGVKTSNEAIKNFASFLDIALGEVNKRLTPYNFNPDSNDQVAALLYDNLKLPCGKFTERGAKSVDKQALAIIKNEHPVVADILENRRLRKMQGTYCIGMYEFIRSDGRVHPNFRPDGARTGRGSCTDPPLQTIPRAADSAEGKMARDMFVAPDGYVLLSADFKQLEYKIAAGLSADPEMLKIANDSSKDFHSATGVIIAPAMGWKLDANGQVGKSERTKAKTTNFAMLFDFGESQIAGLARRLGCTFAEAEKVRNAVLGKFRVFDRWAKDQVRSVQRFGEVWTWWQGKARRRPMFRIASQDPDERSTAERGAINTPIQGTAAEFCTQSAVKIVDWIVSDCVPAKLVLTVHDSLILEVREDCVSEVAATVSGVMLGWPTPGGVKLGIDIEIGRSWGSMEKYDGEGAV